MVKTAKQAVQKCILNKPLYCPKNGEHLTSTDLGRPVDGKLTINSNPFVTELIG
jgi:hypothetical protein